jgi:hypothetical protein
VSASLPTICHQQWRVRWAAKGYWVESSAQALGFKESRPAFTRKEATGLKVSLLCWSFEFDAKAANARGGWRDNSSLRLIGNAHPAFAAGVGS